MTWWTVGPAPACRDLDIVPLTLRPEADGSYAVAGVVRRDGRPLLAGVMAGDRLLAVDGVEVSGATMGRVVGALRGKPGEPRLLLLERDGRRLSERVSVVRLP
jgi:C-terminal processing protease CtpA/Prc